MNGVGLNETWINDGAGWQRRSVVTSPPSNPATGACGFAFHPGRGEAILFRGDPPVVWVWNGASWGVQPTSGTPSRRAGTRMVYDSFRDRMVLFGGDVQMAPPAARTSDETWELDCTTWQWQLRTPGVRPPSRYEYAMAYDSVRRVTVLFGGITGNGVNSNYIGDTWLWDGTNWTQAASDPGMGVRDGANMAFDSGRGVAVLFGGDTAGGGQSLRNDVWEWNGTAWAQRAPRALPRARYHHGMVYDPVRGRTLVVGGLMDGPPLTTTNDTWEYGSDTAVSPFGSGCQGVTLSARTAPIVGAPLVLAFTAPPTTVGFVFLGASDTLWLGPLPHPFPAPGTVLGCNAFMSFDLLLGAVAGGGTWILPLPVDLSLAGVVTFQQALGVATNLSLTTSNALRLQIGGL